VGWLSVFVIVEIIAPIDGIARIFMENPFQK